MKNAPSKLGAFFYLNRFFRSESSRESAGESKRSQGHSTRFGKREFSFEVRSPLAI